MTLPSLARPDKETIRDFFDGIASCYDRVNSVLSLGIDEFWRRRAAELILDSLTPSPPFKGREEKGGEGMRILDLGVGTGKFLVEFLKKKRWQLTTGVDFSGAMLRQARMSLPEECVLIQADVSNLPFDEGSFGLIVSSFTLRSLKDRPHFFEEVRRILRPGGKVAFLCLTRPTSRIGRALYAPYLKFYLPFMGGWISRAQNAYQFLSQSIQTFPSPEEVRAELEACGFQKVSITPFTLGLSTLIVARHPERSEGSRDPSPQLVPTGTSWDSG